MNTDIYTNTVLTVIAISLLVIASNNLPIISSAAAQLTRSDISYCWDLATIDKINENRWQIHTYC